MKKLARNEKQQKVAFGSVEPWRGTMTRNYKSQHEIFQDFQIAVKFRLREEVPDTEYEKFYTALRKHDHWNLNEFRLEVAHNNRHHRPLVGLFLDVPLQANNENLIGARFVLLQHESGPEFFCSALDPQVQMALVAAGTWLGLKVLEKVHEKIIDKAMKGLWRGIRKRWPGFALRVQDPFLYVEIRTEKKGVMRIKLEDFTPTQLTCLVRQFRRIKHLSDVNQSCFGNKLFEPNDGSTE